jgi:hypothetical protein
MFDKPTVLVIGAGAGFDIEMPLGDSLAGKIAAAADFYIADGGYKRGDVRIATALQQMGDWERFLTAGRMIASGIQYSKSIDNYVHTHSDKADVKTVAKLAIVQTILDAEKGCHIALEPEIHPPRFRDEVRAYSSWLTDFFTVLQDGVVEARNLDDIFENLTIVNFNYDRCIEHFLFHVMQRLYPSKGEGYLTELMNAKLKIIHPYGVVGSLPWQTRTNAVQFGGGSRYIEDLAALSQQIRTYNEEIDDKTKVREVRRSLGAASRIIFLGFHFHKQNVELLSAGEDVPDYSGRVLIYGTQVNRSYSDIEIIRDRRLPQILHGRTPMEASQFTHERDCKALFRDFGGVLSG